jgi:hypothetical protein
MSKSTGSQIAKNGFIEQEFIRDLLNGNKNILDKIKEKLGVKLKPNLQVVPGTSKSDIKCGKINIQVKKTKQGQFGQVDRHWVDHLTANVSEIKSIEKMLKELCELPTNKEEKNGHLMCNKKEKVKKLNTNFYNQEDIDNFLKVLNENKKKIVKYAFYGINPEDAPKLFIVSKFSNKTKRENITIYKTRDIINEICNNEVKIRPSGTVFEIGNCFTFQRKGGDGGKVSGNQFQFKFVPTKLTCDRYVRYKILD